MQSTIMLFFFIYVYYKSKILEFYQILCRRCLDCAYEPSCAYSAKKVYVKSFENGNHHWPVSVVTDVLGNIFSKIIWHN
jgi:hypothetical protein